MNMAKAALIIERTQEGIQFDASVSETHTNSAEITQHPVEDGANISDHIRRLPEELTVNVIVTNHPPIILASLRALPISGFGDPSTRAEDAHEFLRGLMKANETVKFVTTLREYTSMAITSMSVVRDKISGNMSNINLTLREIIKAETESVTAPEPSTGTRKSKQNLGKQAKSPATAPTQAKSKSLLSEIFNAIGG